MARPKLPMTERVRKISGGWIIPSETGDCELREELIRPMNSTYGRGASDQKKSNIASISNF
mgnify:CR=1 FL=1